MENKKVIFIIINLIYFQSLITTNVQSIFHLT